MAFLQISPQRGIFYYWPPDWNRTAEVAREEDSGRNRTTANLAAAAPLPERRRSRFSAYIALLSTGKTRGGRGG